MLCQKCGSEIAEGSAFCEQCGTKVASAQAPKPVQPVQPIQPVQQPVQPIIQPIQPIQQPVYQQQPAGYPQQAPVYAAAMPGAVPRKKSHTGLWIFLSVFLILIAAGVFIFAKAFWLGPKDLGIRYTQKEYNDVIQKLGIHITGDLGNGITYDNKDILAGNDEATGYLSTNNSSKVLVGNLNFKDYNWTFSKYEHKKISLSAEETTAFFNEIAPDFWWFKNTQVKIEPDGTILTSSTVDIDKLKSNLFSDVADQIPIPLPGSVNLYTEGDFSIEDNKIEMVPEVFDAGPFPFPKEFLTGESLNAFEIYLERFYTMIPGLMINSAGVENGMFVFDGIIPTEVSVTPKN